MTRLLIDDDIATFSPDIVDDVRRREFLGLFAAAALLVGCSDDQQSPSSGSALQIETPEGVVTLPGPPGRIGILNGRRVFPFLAPFLEAGALQPSNLVGFFGDARPDTNPWVPAQLWDLPQTVNNEEYDLEELAVWRADLFIANGNLGDFYNPVQDALAPVLRLPETDWRLTTQLLGTLLGAPDVAEATIADTDALLESSRLPTPVSAAVVSPYASNGTLGFQVLGAELPNLLATLGIEVAASDTALDGYEDVSVELIAERLEVDWVIVVNNGAALQQALLTDPIFTAVDVVARGNVIAYDEVQSQAGFPASPVSIPVVLDSLAPVLGAQS